LRRVAIYAIGKREDRCTQHLLEELRTNAKRFVHIQWHQIYTKQIHQAQRTHEAQQAYTQALEPHLLQGWFNVALDPKGQEMDSFAFAKLLERHTKMAFFIGGAYGLEDAFLRRCDLVLSLSKLTMSHKVAKIVLVEQIFRGCSIINHHPYHK